ncbi:MAG: hypothetical protein U0840_25660 [Gemmataceae bacterium]
MAVASTAIRIAESLVQLLNANADHLGAAFVARREYLVQWTLGDTDALRVTVVPPEMVTAEQASRASYQHDYVLGVVVQKRVPPTDAAIDPLFDLVERMGDLIRREPLADPVAHCVALAFNPFYSPEDLKEMRQFTSVIVPTFRLWR